MERLSPVFFSTLTDEEKKRLATINERRDLFETKLLNLRRSANSDYSPSALTLLRDPASVAIFLPILESLKSDHDLSFLADGVGLDMLRSKFGDDLRDVTSDRSLLDAGGLKPDVVLTVSNASEGGLEIFASATFNNSPIVLVEDTYGSANNLIGVLKERNLALPSKICVLDEMAKGNIVDRYPDVANVIEVTGSPNFDKIFSEKSADIYREVRVALEIEDDDKLVLFVGTRDVRILLDIFTRELLNVKNAKIKFIFLSHPRDFVSEEEYESIMRRYPITCIDGDNLRSVNRQLLPIAADLVVTTHSTITFESIYRRKPVINITAPEYKTLKHAIDPAIASGGSVEVSDLNDLAMVLPEILDDSSDMRLNILRNQEKFFRLDGRNAERVCDVIRSITKK